MVPEVHSSGGEGQSVPTVLYCAHQIRLDDWVEVLPSQRRLQFYCSYVILLLRISTILFVYLSETLLSLLSSLFVSDTSQKGHTEYRFRYDSPFVTRHIYSLQT